METHLTDKQQEIFDVLVELNTEGVSPTVRSLADRLETKKHRSERFSDAEVRGLLERIEEKGLVKQEEGDPVRYRVKKDGDE